MSDSADKTPRRQISLSPMASAAWDDFKGSGRSAGAWFTTYVDMGLLLSKNGITESLVTEMDNVNALSSLNTIFAAIKDKDFDSAMYALRKMYIRVHGVEPTMLSVAPVVSSPVVVPVPAPVGAGAVANTSVVPQSAPAATTNAQAATKTEEQSSSKPTPSDSGFGAKPLVVRSPESGDGQKLVVPETGAKIGGGGPKMKF